MKTPAIQPERLFCRNGRRAVNRKYGSAAICATFLAALAMGGCRGSDDGADGGSKPVTRTAERGPVTLTVTTDKDEISIAESLLLTIVGTADEGVELTLPDFGDKLEEFQVRRFNQTGPSKEGVRRQWKQEYELDIFLSGSYSIPGVEARFVDARKTQTDPNASPIEGAVSTDEIVVTVNSMLEGEFDPAKFRDIKGPVSLPVAASRRWMVWAGGGLAAVLLCVVAVIVRRRLRRPPGERVAQPHEWAFDRLRELIDAQLVEQGRTQEFFYRLSEITRVYIELRFGLMAPERTTEEFLTEAKESTALPAAHKAKLADFLQACDMVKFARYEPQNEEIEGAFHAARDFVDQTRPAAPLVEAAA